MSHKSSAEDKQWPQKVLRYTQDEMAARAEVARFGGRVVHQFSPTAFVAELPDAVDLTTLTASTSQLDPAARRGYPTGGQRLGSRHPGSRGSRPTSRRRATLGHPWVPAST